MPKVISVHKLKFKAGVNPESLAHLMADTEEIFRQNEAPGWRSYIVKGDRGADAGQYALVHIFDSEEDRARYFPVADGDPTDETNAVYESWGTSLSDRWNAWTEDELSYSDYIYLSG